MRIRIKAPAGLSTTGIYDKDGKEVAPGTELEVEKEPVDLAGRYDIIDGVSSGDTDGLDQGDGSQGNGNGDGTGDQQTVGYAVKEKGGSWFVITKDGVEVTKNFRKADLNDFETLSEEDKEAFVDLHKKDA